MTSPNRTLVVRPCRIRDVPRMSGLLKASWHAAHDHILGPAEAVRAGRLLYSRLNLGLWIARSIGSRALTMLIALQDDAAVGCAMAQRDGAEVILYTLYVHPEWKAQGIGSALLDAVIADQADAKAIRLEVLRDNATAIAWYTTKGFEIYGETKNATGSPNVAALYMDKTLDRVSAGS
jgi:ribosomal protein S18 acetylase RimI-like enzyme